MKNLKINLQRNDIKPPNTKVLKVYINSEENWLKIWSKIRWFLEVLKYLFATNKSNNFKLDTLFVQN